MGLNLPHDLNPGPLFPFPSPGEIFDSREPLPMLSRMRIVQVPLAGRSYKIQIGPGLIHRLGDSCRKLALGRKCAIISDATVAPLYADTALTSLKNAGFDPILITVPAGESSKNLRQMAAIYDQLAAHRLERKSFIAALGGGVVGDLAGFVAATYLRGLAFVQIPTTLLAQVDSSVGGKVGVNLKAGKNLVGAFHQPRLVLCDLDTLRSLPERELRAGLAEVIKYGIIYDARLFRELERDLEKLLARDPDTLKRVVARCCAIKADVVGQDETETGLRAILNFGHTIGHGIEASVGYGKYLHGEAISIGQVAAAWISTRLSKLSTAEALRIRNLFVRAGLPVAMPLPPARLQQLLAAMRLDKKVSAGEIKFVLAEKIGRVVWGQAVPESLVGESLLQTASSRVFEPGS